jgi:TRAP-type C4-dicarboxylate transport system permease small subunit
MAGAAQAKGLFEDDAAPRPPEPGLVGILRKIDRALGKVEEVTLSIALVALIGLGVFQLVRKHWAPPLPFWTREELRYLLLFVAMIGGAATAQADRLFAIDLIGRALPMRGKLALRLVAAVFTIAVCWVTLQASLIVRASHEGETGFGQYELIQPGIGILPLPIGAALIGVHMALHGLIDLYYLVTGRPSPDVGDEPKVA